MSYLSGRHMSRDDYNQSANFVVDNEGAKEAEEEELLSGDFGGRGIGLAGGLGMPTTTSSSSDPDPDPASTSYPTPTPYPTPAPKGTGTDAYAAYDPGMAGCTTDQSTCSIPGLPLIGPQSSQVVESVGHGHGLVGISRGYERDAEEYENENGASEKLGGGSVDNNHAKPSIGSRIVGRVERLAGKVFRDPEIEARGKRHMSGHL